MDQNKKSKFVTYYSELAKKSGLIVPVISALAMFAVLFYVRFSGLFASLSSRSPVGFGLFVAFALIGIALTIAFIATKIKSKDLGVRDILLLTLDFLMIFLLLGMIIFDFNTLNIGDVGSVILFARPLDTLLYVIALVIAIVLNVLRIKNVALECCDCAKEEVLTPNVTVRKYFEVVIGKYGFWLLALVAFVVYGALVLSDIIGFPALFLSKVSFTVGLLLVAAIVAVTLICCYANRIGSRKVNAVDAVLMLAFFIVILSVIMIIGDFDATRFTLWLVALCVVFTLIRILAANTCVKEDATDDKYFVTEGNKTFVQGPKVYFKHLFGKFNLIVLLAISLILFAVLDACVALNVLGWAGDHGFMLTAVVGILLFMIFGLAYVGKRLKKSEVGIHDALLWVLDVNLILLAITIFSDFGNDMIASLVIWAIAFIICVAFTITRLFKVKEQVEEIKQPALEENN